MPPTRIILRRLPPGGLGVRCHAKRSPVGRVYCEKPALHAFGHRSYADYEHAGRGFSGQWFFWTVPRG